MRDLSLAGRTDPNAPEDFFWVLLSKRTVHSGGIPLVDGSLGFGIPGLQGSQVVTWRLTFSLPHSPFRSGRRLSFALPRAPSFGTPKLELAIVQPRNCEPGSG